MGWDEGEVNPGCRSSCVFQGKLKFLGVCWSPGVYHCVFKHVVSKEFQGSWLLVSLTWVFSVYFGVKDYIEITNNNTVFGVSCITYQAFIELLRCRVTLWGGIYAESIKGLLIYLEFYFQGASWGDILYFHMLGVYVLAHKNSNYFLGGVQEWVQWGVQEGVVLLMLKKGPVLFGDFDFGKANNIYFFPSKECYYWLGIL